MTLQIPMCGGGFKIVSDTKKIIKILIKRRYESTDNEEIEHINKLLTICYDELYRDL